MKYLLLLFLPCLSFGTTFDREYTVTFQILDRGDGCYFVTIKPPMDFHAFKFAFYKEDEKNKLAICKIDSKIINIVDAWSFSNMKPIKRRSLK